ncbi:MAG: SWIM zinc finger family protein [Planctomycetia bacterium]|nr:SWIM zinc finger family protein [Planctomycetia bacterium]
MSNQPLLNLDAARSWVGDFEIGKGRPYADAAVTGTIRSRDTLHACVKGTRTRPYRVQVRIGSGVVASAFCGCPVGEEGRCKHVAAVLLAHVEDPRRFAELDDPEANLAQRDKAELIALIFAMLERTPELAPLLTEPLPGFWSVSADPEPFRRRAADVLRAWNPADEWSRETVEEGLRELDELAREFEQLGDATGADAVREGVRQAREEFGLDKLGAIYRARHETHEETPGLPPPNVEPPF